MKHYGDMLCLLCMQQQQQLDSQQVTRAELQFLLLQLTPQQQEYLSEAPYNKQVEIFYHLRVLIAWVQQLRSGLQQASTGPMQQLGLSLLPQVCSRADGTCTLIMCSLDEAQLILLC